MSICLQLNIPILNLPQAQLEQIQAKACPL